MKLNKVNENKLLHTLLIIAHYSKSNIQPFELNRVKSTIKLKALKFTNMGVHQVSNLAVSYFILDVGR